MDQDMTPATDASTLDVGKFAELVGTMNRFLSRFSELEAVKTEELGLVEWLSLRQVVHTEGMQLRQLAAALGVTRQRTAQIVKGLKASGLVETAQEGGLKTLTLSVTEAGKAKAQRLEDGIGAVLTEKLAGSAASIDRVNKRLHSMLKAIKPPKADAPETAGEPDEGEHHEG